MVQQKPHSWVAWRIRTDREPDGRIVVEPQDPDLASAALAACRKARSALDGSDLPLAVSVARKVLDEILARVGDNPDA